MSDEIELKLGLDPGQLNRFRRHGLLRSLAQGRARTHHLVTTYYDTPEQALRQKGAALRVRQRDGKGLLQTLKVPTNDTSKGLVQHYEEHETEIESERPDISLIEDQTAADVFGDGSIASELQPVFTTDLRRRVLDVRLVDTDIEVALDVGEVRTDDRKMPICEAELELKSGKAARLFELALALQESIPVHLERRTKAARGYGLMSGALPQPARAEKIALEPDSSVFEGFPVLAQSCIDHMIANEAAVMDGSNPEGVHQMRVGLRRLRALVAMFRPLLTEEVGGYLKEELRWLHGSLAPARDWDVFIDETLGRIAARQDGFPGLDATIRLAERARDEAYIQARTAVRSSRLTKLLLRLDVWLGNGDWADRSDPAKVRTLDGPLKEFAADALERRDRRMRKLGNRHAKLEEAGLHKLRLRSKNARYVADFFRSLYREKPARRYSAAVRDVQDHLGALNDAVVSRGLLDDLAARAERARISRHEIAQARALVTGWNAGRIDVGLDDLPRVWAVLADQKRFWR